MTTTEHTQTLAQMLKTADRTKMPSEAIFQRILVELGRKTMVSVAWRASLRVLPLLAFEPFSKVSDRSIITPVATTIRTIIGIYKYIHKNKFKQVFFTLLFRNFVDTKIAFEVSQAIYNCNSSLSDNSDYGLVRLLNSVSWANKAAKEFNESGHEHFEYMLWQDLLFAQNGSNAEELLRQKLWKEPPVLFEYYQQKLSAEFKLHKLDFFWHDLQQLWQGLPLESKRLRKYVERFSEDIISDAEQLRQVIEGEVDTQANSAVRVLLLGPGGAGKTSLARILKKQPSNRPTSSTISIEYERLNLAKHGGALAGVRNHQGKPFKPADLQLFLWDFGGQTIFHNLHRGFMRRENCVYVLVVDSRHEQSADQWLQQLQFHLQGDDSLPNYDLLENASPEHASPAQNAPLATVFLITNEYELVTRQQNQRRLLREFPHLLTEHSFINLSCFFNEKWESDKKAAETQRFEVFLKRLVEQCVKSQHVLVKENAQTIQLLNDEFSEQDTWRKSEIIRRLQDKQLVSNADDALQRINKMQDLGQLIQLGDGVDYCINPAWLASVAYKLINSEALKSNVGVASADLIDQLHGEMGDKLMRFLVENHVAAPLGNHGQAPYFFPDATSENEPETVQSLIAHHHWQIHYELDFLPLGFRSQLLTRLLNDNAREFTINITPDATSEVWREGFIAHHEDKTAHMLVQYDTDLRRIAVYLCADNTQEVDAFASLLNSLHNALARMIKPHTKQPRIITPLKTEKDYPEDNNQQAYFALAEKLKGYDIFIAAVEESIVDKNATLKAAKMQSDTAKELATKNSKDGLRNTIVGSLLGTLLGAVLGAFLLAYFTDYFSDNSTARKSTNQSITAAEPNNKSVSEAHINNTTTPIKTAHPENKSEAQTDTKKVTMADNNKAAAATTKKPEPIENTGENTPVTKKVMAAESIKKNLIEGKQTVSDESSSKNVP